MYGEIHPYLKTGLKKSASKSHEGWRDPEGLKEENENMGETKKTTK